jgi:hypothetical protein
VDIVSVSNGDKAAVDVDGMVAAKVANIGMAVGWIAKTRCY